MIEQKNDGSPIKNGTSLSIGVGDDSAALFGIFVTVYFQESPGPPLVEPAAAGRRPVEK